MRGLTVTQGTEKFKFSHANPNEVMQQIEALDKNKSNSGRIPISILKARKEAVCPFLADCINSAIYKCRFPDELKKRMSPLNLKAKMLVRNQISGQSVYYHLS